MHAAECGTASAHAHLAKLNGDEKTRGRGGDEMSYGYTAGEDIWANAAAHQGPGRVALPRK